MHNFNVEFVIDYNKYELVMSQFLYQVLNFSESVPDFLKSKKALSDQKPFSGMFAYLSNVEFF